MLKKLYSPYITFERQSTLSESALRSSIEKNCISWNLFFKHLALGFDENFNTFACRYDGDTMLLRPLGRGNNSMRAVLFVTFEPNASGTLLHITAKPYGNRWFLLMMQFLWYPFIIMMFIFGISTGSYEITPVILLIPASLMMFFLCGKKAKMELPEILSSFERMLKKIEADTTGDKI